MKRSLRFEMVLVLSVSLGGHVARAQVEEAWVVRYAGDAGDGAQSNANALAVDGDGNVYVTGRSDGGYATVKYNAAGRELWVTHYDGNAEDDAGSPVAIVVEESGGVYVAGGTESRIPEVPLSPCSLQPGSDICLEQVVSLLMATVNYDADGRELWVSRYENGGWYDAVGLVTDGAGGLYLAATSFVDCEGGTCSGGDYLLLKYDLAGNELWVSSYDGGGEDKVSAVAVDSTGNVIVTGSSSSGTTADYATVKYDSEGNELWVRRYDGGADDRAAALGVDANGAIYVTGGARVPGDSEGADSMYLTVKYDSDGRELWASRFDGAYGDWDKLDWPVAIAVDAEDNVVVTGGVGWECDLGCAARQYATVKYSSEGEEKWVARYEDTVHLHHMDEVSAVDVDANGNIYIVGTVFRFGEGHHSIVTIKYDPDGNPLWKAFLPGSNYTGREILALGPYGNVQVTGTFSTGILGGSEFVTVKYVQTPVISPQFQRGDCDDNGKLDITDVINFLNYQFVGSIGSPDCQDACDTDDNGILDLTDAVRSLNYQFTGTASAPEPPGSFECGPDPTPDELTCESFEGCQE